VPSRLRFSWVLINELAVGSAPRTSAHLDQLQRQGIASVLSLCSIDEAAPPEAIADRFVVDRVVLPDHRSYRLPAPSELQTALEALQRLKQHGPVYVHCVASMERSPLVCLAWLVTRHRQSPAAALDYLMQVHPPTNPLPGQLRLLEGLSFNGPVAPPSAPPPQP